MFLELFFKVEYNIVNRSICVGRKHIKFLHC